MNNNNNNSFFKPWYLIVLLGIVILLIAIPLAVQFFNQQSKSTSSTSPSTSATSIVVPGSNSTTTPATSHAPSAAVLNVEQSILDNFKANGNDPAVNNGLGGLWVNWKYGTSPLQANIQGNGTVDAAGTNRHDPLTDVRYLHALWLYKSQNPNDTRYQSELDKYTAIVKAEFDQAKDERGWLFDQEFMDLYHLSQDSFYQDTAKSLAAGYAKNFNAKAGTIYKKPSGHPYGSYRVDLVLESGCALIQAGTLFQNSDWLQKGESIVNFVYSHAYISQDHTFATQMDQVLLPNGQVNPSETFYTDDQNQNYVVSGNIMDMGSLSQMIFSLLNTYQVTHQQDFLTKATDLLDTLTATQNSLGLWDSANKGYFLGVTFTGTGPNNPGNMQVRSQNKEAGRQLTMLQAFHLADSFTNNKYQSMEEQMRDVALNKAYYAPGHGVLYLVNADWTPVLVKGQPQNWVTSEAMGIELEALSTI